MLGIGPVQSYNLTIIWKLAFNAVLAREDSLSLRIADQNTDAGSYQTIELWKEQYIMASILSCLNKTVKAQSQKTVYNAIYSTTMSTNRTKIHFSLDDNKLMIC